jgi:AmiR/NasT family two-component response regulator
MYYDLIANPFVLLDALQANSNEYEDQNKVEKGHKGDGQQYGQELEVDRPSKGFLTVYNSLRRGMLPLNSNRIRRLIRVVRLRKKAAKFRCDILRTFIQSPETGNKFSELKFASSVEETCASFLAQACPDLVNRAIGGPTARLIEHPLRTSALSELVEIWTRAAHLFIQLHTQLAELIFTDTNQFIGEKFTEELMKRHQCHPLATESHTQVHLVLTPLIELWGNEDGEDYGSCRIVSKGTVLIGKQLQVEYTS